MVNKYLFLGFFFEGLGLGGGVMISPNLLLKRTYYKTGFYGVFSSQRRQELEIYHDFSYVKDQSLQ